LRGYLKCKGHNNEDKGYLEPTGDAKKEPFTKKKKKLRPKPLGSKSPRNHPLKKLFFQKRQNKTKPNPPKKQKLSWKKKLSCHYKNLLAMAGPIIARAQQQNL